MAGQNPGKSFIPHGPKPHLNNGDPHVSSFHSPIGPDDDDQAPDDQAQAPEEPAAPPPSPEETIPAPDLSQQLPPHLANMSPAGGFDFIDRHGFDPSQFNDPATREAYAPVISAIQKDTQQQQAIDDWQQKAQQAQQKKALNSSREAYYQEHGIKSYVDSFGNHQPVLDDDGKPVYHPKKFPLAYDPATGEAYQDVRDAQGNVGRNFPDMHAPIGSTPDQPNRLFKQNQYQDWEDLGTVDQNLNSENPRLREAAQAANTQRNGLLAKQVQQGFKLTTGKIDLDEQAQGAKYEQAQKQAADFQTQIDAEAAKGFVRKGAAGTYEAAQTEGAHFFGMVGGHPTAQAAASLDAIKKLQEAQAQAEGSVPALDAKTADGKTTYAQQFTQQRQSAARDAKAFEYLTDQNGGDVLKAAQQFRDNITKAGGDPDQHPAIQHLDAYMQKIGMGSFADRANPEKQQADEAFRNVPALADAHSALDDAKAKMQQTLANASLAQQLAFGPASYIGSVAKASTLWGNQQAQAAEEAKKNFEATQQKVQDARDKWMVDNTGILPKVWNAIKTAGKTVTASAIQSGRNGIETVDPSTKFSSYTEPELIAKEAELTKKAQQLEKLGFLQKDENGEYQATQKAWDDKNDTEAKGGAKLPATMYPAFAVSQDMADLASYKNIRNTAIDPRVLKEAVQPGQANEALYNTNPQLEKSGFTTAGRFIGNAGGMMAEAGVNPTLPIALMVLSAGSDGRDAAEAAARARGETDPAKIRELGDMGANHAQALVAPQILLYEASGGLANLGTKALAAKIPGAFAARIPQAVGTGARAVTTGALASAGNILASGASRKVEGALNGEESHFWPTAEEAAQDVGFGGINGVHSYFKVREAKSMLDGSHPLAAHLDSIANDPNASRDVRLQAQGSLYTLQDEATKLLGNEKDQKAAMAGLQEQRMRDANAAIDEISADSHPDLRNLSPESIDQTKLVARAMVKIATGQPIEMLTAEEQKALEAPAADGIPRVEKEKGEYIITQGAIDRLSKFSPEAALTIRDSEQDRRAALFKEAVTGKKGGGKPNEKEKASSQKGQQGDQGLKTQGAASPVTSTGDPLDGLQPAEKARAKLLAQHLQKNGNAQEAEAQQFAGEMVKRDGVNPDYNAQRESALTEFTEQKKMTPEARQAKKRADLTHRVYREAVESLTKNGEAPETEEDHNKIRRAAALFAPAIELHRKAFDEINYVMREHNTGGAFTPGKGKLTLSIGDILHKINQANLEKDPRRAPYVIREEAIHSIIRSLTPDAEVARVWDELPEEVKTLVRGAYIDTDELTAHGGRAEDHVDWNNGTKLGHEYLRMLTEGKLNKQLSEMSSPGLMQMLKGVFQRILDHLKNLRDELTKAKVSPETVDFIDSTTTKAAEAYKKIVGDAGEGQTYDKGHEQNRKGARNDEGAGHAASNQPGEAGSGEVGGAAKGGTVGGDAGARNTGNPGGGGRVSKSESGPEHSADTGGSGGKNQSGEGGNRAGGGSSDDLHLDGGSEEDQQSRELSAEEKLRRNNQPVPVKIGDIEVSTVDEKGKKKADGPVKNFKGGVDPERGIVPGNELPGEEYEDLGKPAIVVWERKDGRKQIVTGRHRLDKARRVLGNEGKILAHVVKEADGFTSHDAEVFDAESNIQDDQGTSADYARYFAKSGITEERARKKGLIGREKGRVAWAVVKEGTQGLKDAFINEQINADQAFTIAKNAPGNEALQRLGLAEALTGASADQVAEVMNYARENYGTREETLDMFGNDDRALQEARAQAKAANTFKQQIRKQLKATQGAAKYPEEAKKLDVDVSDPEALKAKLADLEGELTRWERWRSHPDLASKVKLKLAETKQAVLASRTGGGDPELRRLNILRSKEARGELTRYEHEELTRAEKRAGQMFIPGFDDTRKADMPFTLDTETTGSGAPKTEEQLALLSRKSGDEGEPGAYDGSGHERPAEKPAAPRGAGAQDAGAEELPGRERVSDRTGGVVEGRGGRTGRSGDGSADAGQVSRARAVDARGRDARLVKAFGDDWKHGWNERGLPNTAQTIPEGHTLLQDTKTKEHAYLAPESKAVKLGLVRKGKVNRPVLQDAIIDYFLAGGDGKNPVDPSKKPKPSDHPEIMFMGGGGGAGKSSLLRKMTEKGEFDPANRVLINADEVREFLPEYQRIIDQGDSRAAALTHEESSDITKSLLAAAARKGLNITLDATLANKTKGLAQMQTFKAKGYRVRMLGVTINPHEALTRAYLRGKETGRYVPDKLLLSAHREFNEALPDYAATLGAESTFYDNSPKYPIHIGHDEVTAPDSPARRVLDQRAKLNPEAKTLHELLSSYGDSSQEETTLMARRPRAFDPNQGGFDFGEDKPLTTAEPERKDEQQDELFPSQPGRNATPGKRPRVGGGVAKAGSGQPDLFDFSSQPGNGGAAGEAGDGGKPGGIFGDQFGGEKQPGAGGSDTGGSGADHGEQPGAAGGTGADEERDPAAARRLARIAERRAAPAEQRNFRVERDAQLAPTGDKSKLRANIDAIKLLRTLQEENRNATPEEKATLAKYTGWGGLSQALNSLEASKRDWIKEWHNGYQEHKAWQDKWGAHYDELKGILTPEEFEAAKISTENAHFTSPSVIASMWDAVKGFGFTDGRVLEPAMGIGHFFGLMPPDMADASDLFGVELDDTSAAISQKLYPQSNIQASGFERANLPDNSMDLAISNVPFSEVGPYDPAHADANLNLHNYFFAKALDKAKPGGIVAFITTQHTMDSNAKQRAYLAERGQFLGAIRLPNDAFKANAGTQVVTDVVFMRKSDGREVMTPEPWAMTQEVGREMVQLKDENGHPYEEERPIKVNEYFARHPDMVLGKHSLTGSMYGPGQYTVEPTGDLKTQLAEAIKKLPQNIAGTPDFTPEQKEFVKGDWKPGQFVEQDGKLGVNINGVLTPLAKADERFANAKTGEKLVQKVRDFMGLRDTYANLIEAQRDPKATDEEIADYQAELARHYDKWTSRYGNLGTGRHKILSSDPDYYAVLGLEKVKTSYTPDGKKQYAFSKSDVFTKRTIHPVSVPTEAGNALDAMRMSQSWLGRPDADWMAKLTGQTPDEVKKELIAAGHAFENPATGLIEPKEYYLSGNVKQKLAQARESAKNNPAFEKNVAELEKVQPEPIPINDIAVKLGSGWIPPAAVDAFVHDLLDLTPRTSWDSRKPHFQSTYVQAGDADGWGMTYSHEAWNREQNRTTYSGGGKTALDLLETTLGLKQATVFKHIDKDTRVFDPVNTASARMAQDKIRQAFEDFAKSDKPVTVTIDGKTETLPAFEAMQQLYNSAFNGHRDRVYDGSHLTLPGAADHVLAPPDEGGLRPHQKDGIWRAIQEGSALLAHGVGTGKTNELIGIAREWKRLGTAKKPMVVVQNATLEQFAASYKRMYPDANILVGTKEDLEGPKRKAFMARVASGNWDSVIVPHSSFGLIPDDPTYERNFVNEQMSEIEDALAQRLRELAGKSEKEIDKDPTVKQLTKTKKRWQKKLDKLADRATDDTLTFHQLGVDALLVDEAHLFKKVPFYTRMERVAGLDTSDSDRAYGLWLKLRAIQDAHNGKNTVLATGTPITNTIAEAWNMLRLTNPKALKEFHVETFDRFASAFGEVTTDPEMSPAGKWRMRSRFGSYVNVQELQRMLKSTWDIKDGKDLDLNRPELEGGAPQGVAVERTEPVARYMDYLGKLYDRFEKLSGEDKQLYSYIPLLVYGSGKAATLDMRLIDPSAPDHPGSKVNTMVRNAVENYHASTDRKGTQLIFADTYGQRDTAKLDAFAKGEKPDFSDLTEGKESSGKDDTSEPEDDGEPAAGQFNLYQDIKQKLIAQGIPENEVAVIDQVKNAEQRERLFNRVKDGAVRFLIGSTQKMGTGVNVQDRVYALHNLDAPWTPADLEQRNGRAWRAGNIHADLGIPIKILNYGMKNTIDAGLFDIIERKARFTNDALTSTKRRVSDIGGSPADNAAMMKAIFSGDDRLIQKVKVESDVQRLSMQAAGWKMEKDKARSSIFHTEQSIQRAIDGYDVTDSNGTHHEPGLTEMKAKQDTLAKAMQAPGLRFTVGNEAETEKSNDERATGATIKKCVEMAEPMLLQNAKTLNEPLTLLRGKVRGLDYEIRGRGQMVMARDKEGNAIQKATGNSVVEGGKIVPEMRDVMEPAARYEALYRLGDSVLRQKGITSNPGAGFIEGAKGLEGYYDERIAATERNIADYRARVAELKKGADEPFPRMKELQEAKAELARLDDLLLNGSKKEAPPEKDAETMRMEDDGATPLYSRRGVMPEDSDQLGFDFKNGNTPADRIRNNIGFVDKMAAKFNNIPGVGRDDVRSQARTALMRAAREYTPEKGPFQNYAGRVTRNALIDLYRKEMQYRGREKQTLNEPAPGMETDTEDRIASVADTTQDTAREAGNRDGANVLNRAIDSLPENLRAAIRGVMAGRSLEDIGEHDMGGVSKQRASNVAKMAYTRLRQKLGELGLHEADDVMALSARRSGPTKDAPDFDPYEAIRSLQRLAEVEKPGARTVGRPDLAMGASDPQMMGVDEFRKGTFKPETMDDWKARAATMLKNDREGVRRKIISVGLGGGTLNAEETIAAKRLVADEMRAAFASPDPQQRKEVAMLINAYRQTGTTAGREMRARVDEFKTPEDRHREFIGKMIFTPPPEVRKQIDEAPDAATRKRILEKDQERVTRIEKELAKMGVSLDDIMNGEVQLRLKGAKFIENAGKDFAAKEREAIRMLQANREYKDIAKHTGLTPEQIKATEQKLFDTFLQKHLGKFKAGATAENVDMEALQARGTGQTVSDAEALAEARRAFQAMGFGRGASQGKKPINLKDPVQVVKLARTIQAADHNAFDMAYEYWINSILSGPATHVAIFSGVALRAGFDFSIGRGMEAFVNSALHLVGQHDPRSAQWGEFGQIVKGIIPGVAQAWRHGVEAFDAESSLFKYRHDPNHPLDPLDPGAAKDNYKVAIPGKLGRVIRIPGRSISFADEFFKTLMGRMQVGAEAHRIAKMEGHTGEARQLRMKELIDDPYSDAWEGAVKTGTDWMLQNELQPMDKGGGVLEATGKGLVNLTQKVKPLKFFIPFVRIGYNILATGSRKSPLGTLNILNKFAKEGLYRFKNGEMNPAGYAKGEFIRDAAEQVIAWGAMGMLWGMTQGDNDDADKKLIITGSEKAGESAKPEAKLEKRLGLAPFSIRYNGKTYNYGRTEPFATVLGTTVDMIREIKAVQNSGEPVSEAIGNFLLHVAGQFSDKTYGRGLDNMVKMVTDTKHQAANWASDMLSSFVPNIIKQPMRNFDPFEREQTIEADKSQFAQQFANKTLAKAWPAPSMAHPKIDAYGRPIETGGGLMRALFTNSERPVAEIQKADELLANFNRDNPEDAWAPATLHRTYTVDGKHKTMDDATFEAFSRDAGERVVRSLRGRISDRQLQHPTEADVKMIRQAFEEAHKEARQKVQAQAAKASRFDHKAFMFAP